ncbi:hypothetical protein LPJ53_001841 [Coemansia erecta]|uniref:Uncharacterized protein n=1 Tax=Coemansia erecta TaxID=147472 RepID=A0A9W7Y353_9FUNG|nr:hypothetical protein LPJ53_001841 [Coemansia erecta]
MIPLVDMGKPNTKTLAQTTNQSTEDHIGLSDTSPGSKMIEFEIEDNMDHHLTHLKNTIQDMSPFANTHDYPTADPRGGITPQEAREYGF